MNIRAIFSAAAFALVALCSQGIAQTYSLGYDQTRYDINEGETVDVRLILTEDVSGGGTSRLAAGGANGLFSFSAGVDYSLFSGAANGSTFDTFVLNDLFAGGFAGSGMDVTPETGVVSFEGTEDFLNNDVDGEAGVGGVMTAADIFQVELGTLTFNAGGAGSITTLQLQPHTSAAASPFLFGDNATPAIGFGSTQIFVNAVPEPGSMALIALVAGAGLLRRRK